MSDHETPASEEGDLRQDEDRMIELSILSELKKGISIAGRAIASTESSDRQAKSFDANEAYYRARRLLVGSHLRSISPIIREKVMQLEVLLRQIPVKA